VTPLDPAFVVLALLAISLVLFALDLVRYDLVAVGVVVALVFSQALEPSLAFSGFASEAVILIGSMYVFGHAIGRTGMAEALGRRFLRVKRGAEGPLVARLGILAGTLSSVLSNTGVVATLIPVCAGVGRRRRVAVSRLLMPLAFGSLLGGLVTVIATSTNVVVNQAIRDAPAHLGVEPFSMFEFTHLGLILLAAGVLYLVGPGRALLPKSSINQPLTERYQVPKFVTEILVEPNSTLINRNVSDVDVFQRHGVTVLGIVRPGEETSVLAPGPYNRIRSEDTLILQGIPDDILSLSEELPLKQRNYVETDRTRLYSDNVRLVEAVVPGGSRLVGRSLVQTQFGKRTNLNVLAISKAGELQLDRLEKVKLEIGDTLLVQGHQPDIDTARAERDVLVLDEIGQPHLGRKGWTVVGILLSVLTVAALTPISIAALGLAGVLGLVVSGVLRPDEIYRSVDWSVLVLVGGMLALGIGFQQHVLTPEHTGNLQAWIAGKINAGTLGPLDLFLVLLVAAVGLTQILNNVSTAVILTPIALQLAVVAGVSERPFLMAVVTGTSLAFLSPVAHQANTMVMGPGGYRFRDYFRVGLPLTVGLTTLAGCLIPFFWPFTPMNWSV
jgi:di/tricarboxylate transporter